MRQNEISAKDDMANIANLGKKDVRKAVGLFSELCRYMFISREEILQGHKLRASSGQKNVP